MKPRYPIRKFVRPVATIVLAVLPGVAAAQDARFTLGVGAEYTTGDYGGDKSIDEVYVPVTATVELQRVSVRLTIPYLSVSAPELTTITGPDGQPIVGEGPRVTESGVGDVLASVTVFDLLNAAGGDVALDLTGKVKFGTADEEKGLGTGEEDYTLQADLYRFFERSTLMATAGYSLRGDPSDYELEDTFFASIGTSFAVAEGVRLGAFFDYREASVAGSDSIQELSLFASTRLGKQGRVQFYALAGSGDSSPDWGAGLSLTGRF